MKVPAMGNLWRTTGDISNAWKTPAGGFFRGVSNITDLNESFAPLASPGGWNDPDMLQIGNGVLTADESRSHMSMLAIMAAPLIAGNDIRSMNQTTKDVLLNPDIIAVDQDPAGIQGRRIKALNGIEIWTKPLEIATGITKAVAVFNRTTSKKSITINSGDWTKYRLFVRKSGKYTFRVRVATPIDSSASINIVDDNGINLGSIEIDTTKTNGWFDWYLDSTQIQLEQGLQEIRLQFTGIANFLSRSTFPYPVVVHVYSLKGDLLSSRTVQTGKFILQHVNQISTKEAVLITIRSPQGTFNQFVVR